ncbi:hypothetical protein [Nocardioides alcanivorans]|uniref:hypothetical protein n=1 Tax=Nocardioides alcanivorans TaxID=2897352 RepID=UPI001F32B6AA|nr:hypothetical protein [Nocardioides alcanivorans]
MLSALVGQVHPTATDVRADPGDWGIDVFVGSLVDKVSIWQSKYFYTEIGKSQKAQIRESFASAMKHAEAEGYDVESWTLCVACELSAPERRWWDTKKREWERLHPHLNIDLWDAPVLRRRLMAPEAAPVVASFYAENGAQHSGTTISSRPLPVSFEEPPGYESALFVRQMRSAGISELDGQRAAYFNADLLVRDVAARKVPAELAAVREIDVTLVGHWEDSVADPATSPSVEEYEISARRLFAHVMGATHKQSPPVELPVRPLHLRGFMHRVVEDSRAGWVHDWRDIAREHASEREIEMPAQTEIEPEAHIYDGTDEHPSNEGLAADGSSTSHDAEGEFV